MLPERHVRLLTAYVDGELSPVQRRHADRLLRHSEEARALLGRLQDDARRLRELPRLPAPVDLAGQVMAAIGRHGRVPRARIVPPVRRLLFPVWAGWAAAAAVLLLVGLGSFLSYSRPDPEDRQAQQGPLAPDTGNRPAEQVASAGTQTQKEDEEPPDPFEQDIGPVKPDADAERAPDRPAVPKKSFPEKRPEGPVLTSPSREGFNKFERVELPLPVIHPLHGLDHPDNARALRSQLVADRAFRIEVLARDATRGLPRFRAALRGRKISLVVDPVVQARLRKHWKSEYALFAENLTPVELAGVLAAVGRADRVAAQKKAADRHFDGPVIIRQLNPADRKELADLLGVDPVSARPAPRELPGIDVRKSLGEQTGKEVARALDGKRGPRPAGGPDKQALVLPLSGPRSRSAEVRSFLDQRRPARPGTVQVFLVLRNVAG